MKAIFEITTTAERIDPANPSGWEHEGTATRYAAYPSLAAAVTANPGDPGECVPGGSRIIVTVTQFTDLMTDAEAEAWEREEIDRSKSMPVTASGQVRP